LHTSDQHERLCRNPEDRPEAAALLATAADPGREFDAVVVGEYERAFHSDQFREVVSGLNAPAVAVWLPEAGVVRWNSGARCMRR
jgi:hypothetical protein